MYVFDNFCGKFGGGRQAREERGGMLAVAQLIRTNWNWLNKSFFEGSFEKVAFFVVKTLLEDTLCSTNKL